MGEMIALARSVRPVPCETALEAQVRELRLIAEHKPPYNRRSRAPEREPWVRLTDEVSPRLAVVRVVPTSPPVPAVGPFPSRAAAQDAVAAIHTALPLRRCTTRLLRHPRAGASACALAEMGRCAAPCVAGPEVDGHVAAVEGARQALSGAVTAVVDAVLARIDGLAAQQRYEEAAQNRDQLVAFLRAAARADRLAPLRGAAELVAARRNDAGGWDVVLVRYGRLAGTTVVPRGADPHPAIEALRAAGEAVPPPRNIGDAACAAETGLVADWLEQPGARLVQLDGATPLSWPVGGAARVLDILRVTSRRPGA
jgi:DNA polymerase-3 subunit epsilon